MAIPLSATTPTLAGRSFTFSPNRAVRVVREMIRWRGEFDASQLVVESHGRVIFLRGTVRRPEHVRDAERLARAVVGVSDVVNEIALAPEASFSAQA